jgi:uncharacterized protein DUF3689
VYEAAAFPYFHDLLFYLMGERNTFDQAVALAEELSSVTEDVIDARRIPNFPELVRRLSPRQLAFFCRFLLAVVYEPDNVSFTMTCVSDLLALGPNRFPTEVKTSDVNQAILLAVPGFAQRLVKLVGGHKVPLALAAAARLGQDIPMATMDSPSAMIQHLFGQGYTGESLEENLRDFRADPMSLALVRLPAMPEAGYTEPTVVSNKALVIASHQSEIIIVIGSLLAGKRRADAQRVLARAGLLPALLKMFDEIEWGREPEHTHVHGPSCECNPESSMRIQLLRLIHSYTDILLPSALPFKRLLLSDEERQLEGMDTHAPEHGVPSATECPGLLTRIITTLMSNPPDVSYRYWFTPCIEGFLRGMPQPDRTFVLKSGILQHLVTDVVSEGFKVQRQPSLVCGYLTVCCAASHHHVLGLVFF